MASLRSALATLAAFLGLGLAPILSGCDSGGPSPSDLSAVYVFNQGQFGNDNSGGITTWNPTTGRTGQLGRPGGNVQGGLVNGDRLYVLLNFADSFPTGHGLVNVIDTATGGVIRQFDVVAPRGIAIVGGTAYISAFYNDDTNGTFVGNGVTPVTLSTGEVGEVIPTGPNPDGLGASGGRVFVANSGFGFGTTLSVVEDGAVTNTVDLGCSGPNEVIADGDGEIWVVCSGTSDFTTGQVTADGQVIVVDASSLEIVDRFVFSGETLGGGAFGQDAALDPDGDAFYVLQTRPGIGAADTIYRFNTRRNVREAELSISGEDAVGIGFGGGQLYVGRLNALNPFSDDGFVTVHDADGEEVARFNAGIAPAAFAFAQ